MQDSQRRSTENRTDQKPPIGFTALARASETRPRRRGGAGCRSSARCCAVVESASATRRREVPCASARNGVRPPPCRKTHFSMNHARWPISQRGGLMVASRGPRSCSSLKSTIRSNVRRPASATQCARVAGWIDDSRCSSFVPKSSGDSLGVSMAAHRHVGRAATGFDPRQPARRP